MDIKEPHGRLARWAIYLQSYNFNIVDRPGIQHINADAMSRINNIEISNIIQNEKNIDHSQKALDVWEDSTLLYFLKNLKHKPGASKKQVKRINEKSKHYVYDKTNDKIWYHSDTEDTTKILEVPKIDERFTIILKIHLLGHMNARKTFERLKNNYFWHNMMNNIETLIRNCIQCLEHKRVVLKEHPAIALSIHRLMERIGIDLAFGLPITNEGFNGVIVIIEYLSKYPYAMPIKTKTAEEISEHIFMFISMFGPPEEMMHDQGKEFVNSICNELVRNIGTENLVTSSYHPRTNGLCEKENQTLLRALRKHADKNPLEWHKWLPYCLMAYRDTVHSTTGFTPYELLFGRPMNKFVNYIIDEKQVQQSEITNRLTEIKSLFEETIPQAITNIEKSQITQKQTQERRAVIQIKPLKLNDEVYIEVKKLHPKMSPDYVGPYFIDGITKHQNYWLRNTENVRMKGALPLSRLKVKEKIENESRSIIDKTTSDNIYFDIEKILIDRQRNKKREFFVKWKEQPESENSWVPEENFQNSSVIKDYFKNKRQLKKGNKIQTEVIEINKPSFNNNQITINKTTKWKDMQIFLQLLLIFTTLEFTNTTIISDDFNFCQSMSNMPTLDIDNLCNFNIVKQEQLIPTSNSTTLLILSKLHNIVNGIGYECSKMVTSRYL